jgi:cell division protein FtsQ
MFRKILKITGLLALVVFIIGTLAFSSLESKDVLCRNIEVDYSADELIQIDKAEIIRLVKAADSKILSKKLNQINAETIEKAIEKHDAIINAEVYKVMVKDTGSFRGVLTVKVKHREPVVRVMSNIGNYYLDEFGGKIPTSLNYSANVLAATGFITEEFAKKELLPFVLYVENDDFWRAQIEQIHVENNGDVLLTPLFGEHIIEFGELDDYQNKLQKMKAFYKQVLAQNNWNKYKTISLKYNNQVIAKKR